MGETFSLFIALVGIYVWECSIWADHEALLIDIAARPARSLREPALPSNIHDSGIYVSNVYPKKGQIAVCAEPLLIASTEAVSFPACIDPPLFRYDDMIQIARSGTQIVLNGIVVLKAKTTNYAEHALQLLMRLKNSSRNERNALLDQEVARSMDTCAIRSRVSGYSDATRRLIWEETTGFFLVFAMFPFIVLIGIERILWPIGLVALVTLLGFVIRDFRAASRRLDVQCSTSDLLPLVLSPLAALRAHSVLATGLLEGFDQVAISESICRADQFTQIVSLALRLLSFPNENHLSHVELEHYREWRTRYLEHLDKLVLHSLSRHQLLNAPAPQPDCLSYCPRCESQYVWPTGICSDCNVSLVTFPSLLPQLEKLVE